MQKPVKSYIQFMLYFISRGISDSVMHSQSHICLHFPRLPQLSGYKCIVSQTWQCESFHLSHWHCDRILVSLPVSFYLVALTVPLPSCLTHCIAEDVVHKKWLFNVFSCVAAILIQIITVSSAAAAAATAAAVITNTVFSADLLKVAKYFYTVDMCHLQYGHWN